MTLYDILDWVWYGFTAIIVWPIILGLLNWGRLNRRERSLVLFLVAVLTIEIISTLLRFNHVRNHFMHYLVTAAVLGIIAAFYIPLIRNRRIVAFGTLLLAITMPVEVFLWSGFNNVNTVTETLAWLLLTSLAFVCLKGLLDSPAGLSLRQNPFLYYNTGFFILGFFRAGKSCFVKYFIETSLDLYFFMDTLVVILGAVAYGLLATGLTYRQRFSKASIGVL